jgi:hypothetical protein
VVLSNVTRRNYWGEGDNQLLGYGARPNGSYSNCEGFFAGLDEQSSVRDVVYSNNAQRLFSIDYSDFGAPVFSVAPSSLSHPGFSYTGQWQDVTMGLFDASWRPRGYAGSVVLMRGARVVRFAGAMGVILSVVEDVFVDLVAVDGIGRGCCYAEACVCGLTIDQRHLGVGIYGGGGLGGHFVGCEVDDLGAELAERGAEPG